VSLIRYQPPQNNPVPLASRRPIKPPSGASFIPSLQWLKDATDNLLAEMRVNENLVKQHISSISIINDGRHEDINQAISEGWNDVTLIPYILYETLRGSEEAAHRYLRDFLLDANRDIIGDNSLDLLDFISFLSIETNQFRNFLDSVTSATTAKLSTYYRFYQNLSSSIRLIYYLNQEKINQTAISSYLSSAGTITEQQKKLHDGLSRVSKAISSDKQLLAAIINTSETFYTKDLPSKISSTELSEAAKQLDSRGNAIFELSKQIISEVSASRNIRLVHQNIPGGASADEVSAGFHVTNSAPGQAAVNNAAQSIQPTTSTSYFPKIVMTEAGKMSAEDIVEELNALPKTATYIRAGLIAVKAEWTFVEELIEQLNNLPEGSTLISGGSIILSGQKTVEEFYQEWAATSGTAGIDPDLLSWFGISNTTIISGDRIFTSDVFLDRVFAGIGIVGSGTANLAIGQSVTIAVEDGTTQYIREIRGASSSGIWPSSAESLSYKIETSIDGSTYQYIRGNATGYANLPRAKFTDYDGAERYLNIPIVITIEGNQASNVRITFGGFKDEDDLPVAGNLADIIKIYGAKSYIDGGTIVADSILLGSIHAPAPTGGTCLTQAGTDGSIIVSPTGWSDAGAGIAGFNVWRSSSPSGIDPIFIGTMASDDASFTDTNTTNGTTYYYWLTAFNSFGEETAKPDSDWISATSSYPPPAAPSGLIAMAKLGRIEISWFKGDSSVDHFVLAESTNGVLGSYTEVSSGKTNAVTKYGINLPLNDVALYAYKIKCVSLNGVSSPYSTPVAVDTTQYAPSDGYPPLPPSSISVSGDMDGRIVISWPGSTSIDADKYRVFRKTTGDYFSIAEIAHTGTGSHTYIDPWLENGTTYCYRITTIDKSGMESIQFPASDTATGIATDTNVSIPTGLSVTGSQGALNVSWSEISEPRVTYEIWRCKSPDWTASSGKLASVAGTASGIVYFVDNDPEIGTATSYSYKVRAIDRWGNIGQFSDTASGTSTVLQNGIDASGYVVAPFRPTGTSIPVNYTGLFSNANYMGYISGGVWKTYMDSTGNFYLGGSSSGFLSWNSTSNLLNVSGTIWSTSGNIGGWSISSGALFKDVAGATSGTSVGLSPSDYPFYAGKPYANRATAPFRVDSSGQVTCSRINITSGANSFNFGCSGTIGGNLVVAGDIVGKPTSGDEFVLYFDGASGANKIYSNTITLGGGFTIEGQVGVTIRTGAGLAEPNISLTTTGSNLPNHMYINAGSSGSIDTTIGSNQLCEFTISSTGATKYMSINGQGTTLFTVPASKSFGVNLGSSTGQTFNIYNDGGTVLTCNGGNLKSTFNGQIVSTYGSTPFSIANSGMCANLNADLLDGVHATGFITSGDTVANATKLNNVLASGYAKQGVSTTGAVNIKRAMISVSVTGTGSYTSTGWTHGWNTSTNSNVFFWVSAYDYSTAGDGVKIRDVRINTSSSTVVSVEFGCDAYAADEVIYFEVLGIGYA
jgi:hypothetical protein